MTRAQQCMVAVVALELAAGAWLFAMRWTEPAAPLPELSYVDPLVAEQVRTLAAQCRSPDDWARLGSAYLAYGYFNEGEACYRQAAALEPAVADRAYEWAFALERIGKTAEANEQYERAIKLGHLHADECWYYMGRNWLRAEKADEARAAFQEAGRQPAARYELARLLNREGKPAEAVAILTRLSAEFPRALQPYLLRHRIELLKDSPAAAVYADLALRAQGHLPTPFDRDWDRLENVHDTLGLAGEWRACKALLSAGMHVEAEPRLKAALGHEWDPVGADLLAEVELLRGRHEEAIRILQLVLDRAGPSVHTLTRLGDAYEEAKKADQAVRLWSRAVQMGHGADVKNQYFKMAMQARNAGDKKTSRRYEAQAYYAAGHDAFWNDKMKDARITLEKAVELDPGLAAAWFYLGEMNRLMRQPGPARTAYAKCLAIDSGHGRAHAGLALLDAGVR